ncbi:MAG: hypothetical protein JO088_07700 [Acidobacteria bacterium]|nr:hypothetical protein [Acidobacteriota bacterium]MBV9071068.1 hypothetical protein [Acidobacteriota bacterium]
MPDDGDSLLARAAAVIANARNLSSETARAVDTGRLRRLQRDLLAKLAQIDQLLRPGKQRRPH